MSVLIRRSDAIAIIQNADYKYPTWPHIVEAKEGMVQAIKSAPTIDAVSVVRCGECAYNYGLTNGGEFNPEDIVCGYFATDGIRSDDFCSQGIKKEDKP